MTTMPSPLGLATGLTLSYDAWNRLVRVANGQTTVAEYPIRRPELPHDQEGRKGDISDLRRAKGAFRGGKRGLYVRIACSSGSAHFRSWTEKGAERSLVPAMPQPSDTPPIRILSPCTIPQFTPAPGAVIARYAALISATATSPFRPPTTAPPIRKPHKSRRFRRPPASANLSKMKSRSFPESNTPAIHPPKTSKTPSLLPFFAPAAQDILQFAPFLLRPASATILPAETPYF